jgi:Cu-processing system permease protein
MERGTMLLLLSYPVARWQVLLGKFLGHLAVLAFATCLGYGLAAAALLASGSSIESDSLAAFAAMIGSSILLGAVFVAIGYLVSALVRDRGTAAGVCIGLWLLLVLLYDMALLGLLALDQGRNISGTELDAMLLFNPADVYRLLNLTGFAHVSTFAGMAGLAQSTLLSIRTLLAALMLWTVVPLAFATLAFSRREL